MIRNFDNESGMYYNFQPSEPIPAMEFWKPITDLSVPGVLPIYIVSDLGRIYNTTTNSFIHQYENAHGYFQASLRTINGSKNVYIYRIVIIEFLGYDPNPERDHVDHISGVKANNTIYNLRWLTKAENVHAAMDLGLVPRKLTDDDVRQICVMLQSGEPRDTILNFIASKGFTHPKTVFYDIYNRKHWKHISKDYPNFKDYRIRKPAFSDEQVHIICKCLENNMKHNIILDTLGIDRSSLTKEERTVYYTAISHIKRGTTSPEISANYNIDRTNQKKLFSDKEVRKICELLEAGFNANEILVKLGYEKYANKKENPKKYMCYMNAISRIRTHNQYRNISSDYNF